LDECLTCRRKDWSDGPPPADTPLAGARRTAVEVVVRLWDSWEDDAVIRDRATGRYVDRGQAALASTSTVSCFS